MTVRRAVFPAILLAVLATPRAEAVSCPSNGAKIKIVINNPTTTTGQQVFLSGSLVEGQATCVGQADTYATTVTLTSTGNNTFILPASGGLNTGLWVHHISIGDQFQHRRTPVLFTSNSSEYATVRWTYHPTVIQVNKSGDATGSCTGGVCTLRQAIAAANALVSTGSTPAILIQLMLSPGIMTQTADLTVGIPSAPEIISIDGTDASGNPWIVGDALATAQGNQSPFLRAIDLKRLTRIVIAGENVTLRGFAIANSGTTTLQSDPLVEISGDNAVIEAIRLDGGASGTCGTCIEQNRDLFSMEGEDGQIVNVEGRSAFSNGAHVYYGVFQGIRDSWFHHNWGSAVKGDGVQLERNMLELSGRRLSDNAVVSSAAVGVRGEGASEIGTIANVIRNNTQHGIDSPFVLGVYFANDFVCGNGGDGIVLRGTLSSNSAFGTGLATTYNGNGVGLETDNGVLFTDDFQADTVFFDNDSTFTANAGCGMFNDTSTSVSAENNQWRGVSDPSTEFCEDSPDFCTSGGPIDCNPIQNYPNKAIVLNSSEPTYPRNAFIKGQTVRVQGSGFNAIDGNPEAGTGTGQFDCEVGSSDVSSDNCCRNTAKANVCAETGSPPNPPSDGSNCVAILDGTGSWRKLSVTSVTPTTIVTEVPAPALLCIGETYTQTVRVVKQGSGGQIASSGNYCRNTNIP